MLKVPEAISISNGTTKTRIWTLPAGKRNGRNDGVDVKCFFFFRINKSNEGNYQLN